MAERVTLRQVAELAGTSLGTASHALANKSSVQPETRARVLEAAAALGYRLPVRMAVSTGKPLSVIGLLTKQDVDNAPFLNPFYSHILAGAERECQRNRVSLMYATVAVDERNRPSGWPVMLSEQQIDGLIVVGTFLEDLLASLGKKAVQNIVLVDAYAPSQPFDSVVIDNINGAQVAVEHLIQQGHRHIGLVGSTPDAYPSIRERRKGYMRALREHDIAETYIEDSELSREGGYKATIRLLQRSPQVSAIFACNDMVAFGVMSAARDLKRSVPESLSVIGFDDIDPAQEVIPPLTTVHVDKVLMGVLAVRLLHDRSLDPERAALTTSVGTQLIRRDSVTAVG